MSIFHIQSEEEYLQSYRESIENPEGFWDGIANNFLWKKKWDQTLKWNFTQPKVEWFINGKLNITENCLDRHVAMHPDKTCILWEPNDPNDSTRKYSYQDVFYEVNRFCHVLKRLGVEKGDRVCIYLPMIPEATFAMLACARIGAIHSVVFAGFSARSLHDRIEDAQATLVITSDGLVRGDKKIILKEIVDEAIQGCDSIENVLIIQHTNDPIEINAHDHWYHDIKLEENIHFDAVTMDAEDPLFILYTSGSTGKPKGVVHHCGGYMVYAGYSFQNVFQYNSEDIFWCTADVGWITGHSYITYGPLLAGATMVVFEGIPTYPHPDRFWQVVDKYQVNQFYTAPTAIRALMACGDQWVQDYDLSSLKVIGSVGEPINEEAWEWYFEKIGKNNAALVDTWWQTETGGIMLSNLGAIGERIPTYAGKPLPGIQPVLLDVNGNEINDQTAEGLLAIKFPWPSIIRTTWGDHERCRNVYFGPYANHYFTGDGAKRNENGLYRIIGRVDDVINVSGHRLGTAEIENAINEHNLVVESAVVGYPHDIKGQGIYAYVIVQTGSSESEKLIEEINEVVSKIIGKIAKPDKIQLVTGLPKTRSGKIMRRILRKIAEGQFDQLGDISTLLDTSVVESIIQGRK